MSRSASGTESNYRLMAETLRLWNRGGDLHSLVCETIRASRYWPTSMPWDCDFAREKISLISSSLVSRMPSCWRRTSCVPRSGGPCCARCDSRPILECTCGLVLTGRTDPDNPLFTEGAASGRMRARNCSRFRTRPISVQIRASAASMPATNRLPWFPCGRGMRSSVSCG